MMHRCKELLSNISRLNKRQRFSLHQFRAKSNRRFIVRDSDNEDDDEISGKEPEIQEGRLHLFKSRGQHLLTNPRVLDTIVRKSNIDPSDTVLEIGPGTGNLTMKLLEAAQRVIAVEIDKRMMERVQNRAAERGFEERLTIIGGDALKAEFPRFDLVVANIPYGISSPLVAKLVFGENKFRSATLLLQKEFARRLLANPRESEFNRLAANAKLVAEVEFVMDVSKADFVPIPKVDSSVIKIYPKEDIESVDLNEWWAFTRTCFSNKNKTLGAIFKQKRKLMVLMKLSEMRRLDRNAEMHSQISQGYGTSEDYGMCIQQESDLSSGSDKTMSLFREKVINILKSGGFEGKRPSKLSNEEFLLLLSLFNQSGIYFQDQAKLNDASEALLGS